MGFDALPGQRFLADYKEHNTQADAATSSYQVVLTLQSPEKLNVLPGMSASVFADLSQILAVHHSEVTVPSTAVFQSAAQTEGTSQSSVWLVDDDNILRQHAVTSGELTATGIQILTGLKPGDRILTAGVHQASDGMKVKPWTQERGL